MIIEDIIMEHSGRCAGREIVSASFEEWLAHVFDHPPTSASHWRWNDDYIKWGVSPSETAAFLVETFEKSGSLLKDFSDEQIADGLEYVCNLSLSNIASSLVDLSVPWLVRQNGIRSIKTLYSDCFQARCASFLSHLAKPGGAEGPSLNGVCYMWWDVFPIVGQPDVEDRRNIDQECLNVMEFALSLSSDACQESALHGLGHWFYSYPEHSQRLIDVFLAANPNAGQELIAYAMNARGGNVL